MAYLPGGVSALTEMNKHIDEGAVQAGRDPSQIRRLLNISGQFLRTGRSPLNGPPQQWAQDLAAITLEYGITGFILAADDAPTLELWPRPRVNSSPLNEHAQGRYRAKAD
jgi:hypothetical protein